MTELFIYQVSKINQTKTQCTVDNVGTIGTKSFSESECKQEHALMKYLFGIPWASNPPGKQGSCQLRR